MLDALRRLPEVTDAASGDGSFAVRLIDPEHAALESAAETAVLLELKLRRRLELVRQHQPRYRHRLRELCKRPFQRADPERIRNHIVVGERDNVADRFVDRPVPSPVQPGPRLADVTDADTLPNEIPGRSRLRRVVDDENFVRPRLEGLERVERTREVFGAVARAHGDGDGRQRGGRSVVGRQGRVQKTVGGSRPARGRTDHMANQPPKDRPHEAIDRRAADGGFVEDPGERQGHLADGHAANADGRAHGAVSFDHFGRPRRARQIDVSNENRTKVCRVSIRFHCQKRISNNFRAAIKLDRRLGHSRSMTTLESLKHDRSSTTTLSGFIGFKRAAFCRVIFMTLLVFAGFARRAD